MILDLKNIHIGALVSQRIEENGMDTSRVCKFLKCTEAELRSILLQKSIEIDIVLRLSILLEYDFFRIYSQYLILYAPQMSSNYKDKKSVLPNYRKNIYTKEVVDFILEQIEKGTKTKAQIISEYRIPKTTLYKWINKYRELK